MKITFTIRERELKAALCVAGHDETRPSLCGVYFELRPDKPALLIATDGRRLAMIESEGVECAGESPACFTLQSQFCRGSFGYLRSFSDHIGCQYDTESETLTMGEVTFGRKAFVGGFPNYKSLLWDGDSKGTEQICLSGRLLEGFSTLVQELFPDTSVGLTYAFREPDGVVEISCSKAPNFYGLLMPMKDEIGFVRPSFVTDLIPAQEKTTHPACS